MNRADRRAKGIPEDVYKALLRDLDNQRKQMRLEIIQQIFGVVIVSLRDEFGWFQNEEYGIDRIHRFIDRFNENMEYENEGNVKLDDFNEWCKENNINYEVKKMEKEAK
jgi:hypothetical protein